MAALPGVLPSRRVTLPVYFPSGRFIDEFGYRIFNLARI